MADTEWQMVPKTPTDRMNIDGHVATEDYIGRMLPEAFTPVVYAAMLAAAPTPPPLPVWQDIATAPKDGTRVLLGRFVDGDKRDGYIAVDRYRRSQDGVGYIGWGKFNTQHWPPTHWMPLPAPPPAKQSQGSAV